jgi:hypothetical protein
MVLAAARLMLGAIFWFADAAKQGKVASNQEENRR